MHELGNGDFGRRFDQEMHVIVLAIAFLQLAFEVFADRPEDAPQIPKNGPFKYPSTIFGNKDPMPMKWRQTVSASAPFCRA